MPFYYYLGLAYYQKNMSDEALRTFQKGVSVITAQSDASIVSDFYAVMGDILHDKGRQKEAFAAYDSCLQWKDDNIGCLNNYAYYISLTGNDLGRAEQMSYKTVKAEPTNSTFLDTYAWILFLQKRYEAAKMYIDQALINNVDSSAVIIEHAGDIYALNKNIDKAVELWKRAADISKDNKLLIRKIKFKKYIRE
jgi:tetratricopeptide (TPR) repeat protein